MREEREYEAIVVGSGPGGATVARELARAGRRVLLLEKGKDHQELGTYWAALRIVDQGGNLKSKEGLPLLKATTTGGATVVYSASAAMPPPWLKPKYGIDLDDHANETWEELKATILPEELLGEASRRVMEAANRIGYKWEPMPKLLDISKFKEGLCCGAKTSLGCTCGAKWTAREYIKQAVEMGATLVTQAECEEVMVKNGKAVGVKARLAGRGKREFHSELVVLCAGGIPSPVILKRAGIERAGNGCYVDPTILVYGIAPYQGSYLDPLVSVVTWEYYDSHGIRIGTLLDPGLMTVLSLASAGAGHIWKATKYKNMIGILVKVKDELAGGVSEREEVSKPLTEADREKLKMGCDIAREVLVAAGCRPDSIVPGQLRGSHPSGTCRIGDVVNDQLETEIKNLYVCDASVFPEALDRPTVITIVAFAKRLAGLLLGKEKAKEAAK